MSTSSISPCPVMSSTIGSYYQSQGSDQSIGNNPYYGGCLWDPTGQDSNRGNPSLAWGRGLFVVLWCLVEALSPHYKVTPFQLFLYMCMLIAYKLLLWSSFRRLSQVFILAIALLAPASPFLSHTIPHLTFLGSLISFPPLHRYFLPPSP